MTGQMLTATATEVGNTSHFLRLFDKSVKRLVVRKQGRFSFELPSEHAQPHTSHTYYMNPSRAPAHHARAPGSLCKKSVRWAKV